MLWNEENLTREFGVRRTWRGQDGRLRSDIHLGRDYAETYGNDPVTAIQPGRVVDVGWDPIFGYFLWVRRPDGVVVKYHMFKQEPDFNILDQIRVGQYLGLTGASANNAKGNHCHVQVEIKGEPVNPKAFMPSTAGGGSTPFPPAPVPAPTQGESEVKVFKEFQSAVPNSIASKARAEATRGVGKWWRLWLGADQEHSSIVDGMAAPGYMHFILHLEGTKLTAGEHFDFRLVRVQNGRESNHYRGRVNGAHLGGGEFAVHVPFAFYVPAGADVFVDVLGSHEAQLDRWGASVTNFGV